MHSCTNPDQSFLDFRVRLLLILQQSSRIRTAMVVQIVEIKPAIVNASNMKPIISSVNVRHFVMIDQKACRIRASLLSMVIICSLVRYCCFHQLPIAPDNGKGDVE